MIGATKPELFEQRIVERRRLWTFSGVSKSGYCVAAGAESLCRVIDDKELGLTGWETIRIACPHHFAM